MVVMVVSMPLGPVIVPVMRIARLATESIGALLECCRNTELTAIEGMRLAGMERGMRLMRQVRRLVVVAVAPAEELPRDQPEAEQRHEAIGGDADPVGRIAHGERGHVEQHRRDQHEADGDQ